MEIYRDFIKLFSCFPNFYVISATVTTCVALPLYLLVLVVLFKSRKMDIFDGVFFQLVLILGVIDILSISHIYIFVKLPALGMFFDFYKYVTESSPYFARYGHFVVTILSPCQFSGTTLTSLNRFTTLAFPMSPTLDRVREQLDPIFVIIFKF